MKIIIAGSRDITDYDLLLETIKESGIVVDSNLEIVSGMAKGVDSLGVFFAGEHELKLHRFPADWKRYKSAAGPIRNAQMGDFADGLIALTNGSRGTAHMIKYMKDRGKWHYVKTVDKPVEPFKCHPKGLLYDS